MGWPNAWGLWRCDGANCLVPTGGRGWPLQGPGLHTHRRRSPSILARQIATGQIWPVKKFHNFCVIRFFSGSEPCKNRKHRSSGKFFSNKRSVKTMFLQSALRFTFHPCRDYGNLERYYHVSTQNQRQKFWIFLYQGSMVTPNLCGRRLHRLDCFHRFFLLK